MHTCTHLTAFACMHTYVRLKVCTYLYACTHAYEALADKYAGRPRPTTAQQPCLQSHTMCKPVIKCVSEDHSLCRLTQESPTTLLLAAGDGSGIVTAGSPRSQLDA